MEEGGDGIVYSLNNKFAIFLTNSVLLSVNSKIEKRVILVKCNALIIKQKCQGKNTQMDRASKSLTTTRYRNH